MADVIQLHWTHANEVLYDTPLQRAALSLWSEVFNERMYPFRNAQVTLLAPTGTIGLLMDCDTLGVEPDFALIKHKNLAGGGEMTLVNEGVQQALAKLDYKAHSVNLILAYVREYGTVEGCPDLKTEHQSVFDCANPPSGFSRTIEPMGHIRMCAAVQPFLSGAISKTINMSASATVEDVSTAYMAAWKLGLKAVSIYRDGSKLAQPLSAARAEAKSKTTQAQRHEVAQRLKDSSITMNEARTQLGDEPDQYPERDMSKFQNQAQWAEPTKAPVIEELNRLYVESKREDAEAKRKNRIKIETAILTGRPQNWTEEQLEKFKEEFKKHQGEGSYPTILDDGLERGVREYLPWRRKRAEIQKIKIGPGGQSLVLTLGRYPDGRLGEVYVELSRTGPTLHAFGNLLGMMISIGLQYGVPVDEYVKRLSGRQFEPSGLVEGHEQIKWAASIADYIARELGLTFLGRAEMGQAKTPEEKIDLKELEELYTPKGEEKLKFAEVSPTDVEIIKRREVKTMLDICPACGEPSLTRNGSCNQCTNGACGYNDGCGG